MDAGEFKAAYSPLFTELWKFFKRWGMNPPGGKDHEQFTKEIVEIRQKYAKDRFGKDMVLACVKEIERLAGVQDGRQE